jgi:hypothetical protein
MTRSPGTRRPLSTRRSTTAEGRSVIAVGILLIVTAALAAVVPALDAEAGLR